MKKQNPNVKEQEISSSGRGESIANAWGEKAYGLLDEGQSFMS